MATRRERVVLDVESNVSASMLKDAAATALLKRELNSLSKTAVQTRTSVGGAGDSTTSLGRNAKTSSSSINQLSGRLALLVKTAGALGPAFAPITTAAVPAIAGLTTYIGFSVLAAGTAVVAFQGVGDALKAMNDAHLKPTAANLEKARLAMENLSPAAQAFVRKLREMGPELRKLRDAAAGGLMPGLIESLDSLDALLPQAERIFHTIGDAMGDALADGAESLAGPRWADFFDFIEAEARPTLTTLGKTVGNLTHGLAEMWMAFDPASDDFADGLLRASNTFDDWAQRLSQTQDFQEFLAYIRETGPLVLDTLGSIGDAFLQIGEAAAPLGGPVLQVLKALADIIAFIADSPLGTPIMAAVTAMSALSLATGVFNRVGGQAWKTNIMGANGFIAATAAARRAMALGTGAAGLLALSLTDVDEKAGLANTGMFAMAGLMVGGLPGLATGALIGGIADMSAMADETSDAIGELRDEIASLPDAVSDAQVDAIRNKIKKIRDAIQDDEDDGVTIGDRLGTFGAGLNVFDGDVWEKDRMDALGHIDYNNTEAENKELAAAEAELEDALGGVTEEAYAQARALQENVAAMVAKREESLRGLNAELNYAEALLDTKEGIKDHAGVLAGLNRLGDAHNQKQIEAARLLHRQASAWNELSTKAQNMPGAFKAAHDALVANAIQLGLNKRAAEKFATAVLEIPTHWNTTISADVNKALLTIDVLKQKIAGIHGKTITIYANHLTRGGNEPENPNPFLTPADGTTVPGPRFPYRDRVPALLAPTEEVISNRYGQADRWRPLLKAINANQMADGGTAAMLAQRGAYWRSSASRTPQQPIRVGGSLDHLSKADIEDAFDRSLSKQPVMRIPNAGQGAFSQGADF